MTKGDRTDGHTDAARTGPGCSSPGTVTPERRRRASRSTATSPTPRPPTPTTAGTTTPSSSSGCPTTGTAGSSSPAPRASASSTPTTSSSATGCSPRATPSPPPTRATPAPTFYQRRRRARRRRSPSGTSASPSSPSPPRRSSRQRYGRAPARTYMAGISNGGYLTRWQLENRPELYDGGVDWEGTLFDADGPEPVHLPADRADATTRRTRDRRPGGARRDDRRRLRARLGVPVGRTTTRVYWDLTQRIYREEFDPDYDGAARGRDPVLRQPGTPSCDADYDYASRPHGGAGRRSRKVALTGRIGKPLLTLHGTLDALLPIATDSDVYDRMVDAAGRGAPAPLLRDRGRQPRRRPLRRHPGPAAADAALLPRRRSPRWSWVEHGTAPPPSQFVARPAARRRREHLPLKAVLARRGGRPGLGGWPTPNCGAASASSTTWSGAAHLGVPLTRFHRPAVGDRDGRYTSDPKWQWIPGYMATRRGSPASARRRATCARRSAQLLRAGASRVFLTLRDLDTEWGIFTSEGLLNWPVAAPKPA